MNKRQDPKTPTTKSGPEVSWTRELMASLVVFLVALPLCMGIAIASGVPPALGLISGMIGGLVVGSLAGAPLQVSGPAAGLAVLVWQLVQSYGIAALGVAGLVAGLLQIAAGALKLGRWFRAVSPALIQGMLAGIGVLIFASQFHVMLDGKPTGAGLRDLAAIPLAIWTALTVDTGGSHTLAAIVGVVTIVTIVAWNELRPAKLKVVPGPLVAVVVGTLVANLGGMGVKFVSVPNSLLGALNIPTFEGFKLLADPAFLSAALGLALIASAETLLCATATDRMTPHNVTRYDKELIAQGVGNTLAGALGALPITGVIVRTTANVEAGARTRYSAVAHGGWLLLLVVALPVLLTTIPTSCLAAILVYTGVKLANPKQLLTLWKAGRGEALVFGITVLAIVSTNLLIGVIVGLVAAILKVLRTVSDVQIEVVGRGAQLDVTLRGAATFIRLPTIAAVLESLPVGKHIILHVGELTYVDHACMDLLKQWQARYERDGGKPEIAWDTLELRHKSTTASPTDPVAPKRTPLAV